MNTQCLPPPRDDGRADPGRPLPGWADPNWPEAGRPPLGGRAELPGRSLEDVPGL